MYKKVIFNVKDENGLINNYNIKISNKEVQPKEGNLLFIGEEIEQTWQISVSHKDYETENFSYRPDKGDNPKYIILKQKKFSGQGQLPNRKKFYIKIDEKKGKRSYKDSFLNEFEYEYPQFKCDSKYGYKFERWESFENKPYGNYDGFYEAIFKDLWYQKVPKLVWIIGSEPKERNIWQRTFIFWSDDPTSVTDVAIEIPDICSKIEIAIAMRNAINLGKIDELKGQMFSESQQNFKNSIDSIEDKYKKQIGDTLNARTVSAMNLNKVADLILKTQSDLRKKEKIIQKENELEKNRNQDKQNDPKIKDQQKNNTQNQQNSQTQKQQSNSNSLENEFWDLVHSGNAQMETYSNLLKKHKNTGGDIIAFLNKICKNSASFKKFKDIPEMDRKSAKTLTEIDIN